MHSAQTTVQYRALALPELQAMQVDAMLEAKRPATLDIRMEVWGLSEDGTALLCFLTPDGRMGRLGSARLSVARRAEIMLAQHAGCRVELHLAMTVLGRRDGRYGVAVSDPEGELVVHPAAIH
jgi:hypothetical protein